MAEAMPINWSEFGLQGVVIASLFAMITFVGKWLVSHIGELHKTHTNEREQWRKDDLATRQETIATLKEISNSNTETMKEVRTELRSLSDSVLKSVHEKNNSNQ